MPVLVLAVPKDLDKLLEDSSVAAITSLSEMRRVVVVAVDLAIMLVVAVLRTENCRTDRAGEVFNVILSIDSRDVRPTQRATTLMAEKVKTPKVVSFTQGILVCAVFLVNREEFGSNRLATILYSKLPLAC